MNKKKKQLIITLILLLAGLLLGLALGILVIPSAENTTNTIETAANNPTALGNPEAKVQIVEFSDYECEYCKKYNDEIFKTVMTSYINENKISYTFKDYPLDTFYNNTIAALSTHCANDQKKYWEMHDKLFENQNLWKDKGEMKPLFIKFAQSIGLNLNNYNNCINSQQNINTVIANIEEGKKLGVMTTPTVFINQIKIEGLQSPEYYTQIIEDELNN